jgi:hypothetical protein
MPSLAQAIQAQQRRLKIESKSALARRIGISLPTLYNVLSGARAPNARTVPAYARFLRMPQDRVETMARGGRSGRPYGRRRR